MPLQLNPSLTCPHCGAAVDLVRIPHQGLFRSERKCPQCGGFFEVDGETKRRQAWLISLVVVSLVLTLLLYFQGMVWLFPACMSYVLIGGLIIHANRKVRLVPWDPGN